MSLPRRAHPYHVWEDFLAGMYDQSPNPDLHVALARDLLGSPPTLGAAMRAAVANWPIATEHRLTAFDTNRRAWLGAAACFTIGGCPEHATRSGWWQLAASLQAAANREADRVIVEWETARSGVVTLFSVLPTSGDLCA